MDPVTPEQESTIDLSSGRPLAVVTGGSRGIGLELARQFCEHGHDVVIVARGAGVVEAAEELRSTGVVVLPLRIDLSTGTGVRELHRRVAELGRPVDVLALNAGAGVAGGRFVDTDLEDHLAAVALDVTSVVHLAGLVVPAMVERGQGRVLFTSSVAATMPGPYYATYAASKAFVQSFAQALRSELDGTGVTVTSLMPGPTDTAFFDSADLEDSLAGRGPKDDPAEVARDGFEALMEGRDHVVAGAARNHLQSVAGAVLPERAAARVQGAMTRPRRG